MSGKRRKKIQDAIRELGKADRYEIYSGKVSAVNEDNATCDVDIDDDLTVFDVMLRSIVSDKKGMWVLPKLNSYVDIGQIDGGTDFILIAHSEIDKAFINIGDKSFEISADGVVVNGGENGGVPIAEILMDNYNSLKARLDAIETNVGVGLNAVGASTAASGAAGKAAFEAAMLLEEPVTLDDPENPDFTH